MSFTDKLKAKADELKLQEKATKLGEAATKAAEQAKVKAGDLAHDNRDKITTAIDKAGEAVDKRTGGKYADQITKAKGAANKGADKLAEQGKGNPNLPDQEGGGVPETRQFDE